MPGTFADAVRRRLDGLAASSRRVIDAAAVLGRRFDWRVVGPVTGMPDAAVAAALRQAVGLQLVAADRDGFRFRHALTHEAVLAGLLPPERALLAGQALAAAEAAHPGLPGTWCVLAAELAGVSGNTARAGALLLEAGRRDLAVGALASAEQTLTRAGALIGPDDPALRGPVGEALTEVFALSGQVDRAIEMGKALLARFGGQPGSARVAALHLGIARAAIAGGRWAEAAASVEIARRRAGADTAQVDACAAQVAVGRGELGRAGELARTALAAAEGGGLAEVACEALEVIGRVARQSDLDAAERAFIRAATVASAHGLRLWHARRHHGARARRLDRGRRAVRGPRLARLRRLRQARVLTGITSAAIATPCSPMTEPETGPRGHFIANDIMAIPAQLARDLADQVRLVKVNVEHADHPVLKPRCAWSHARGPVALRDAYRRWRRRPGTADIGRPAPWADGPGLTPCLPRRADDTNGDAVTGCLRPEVSCAGSRLPPGP